MKNLHVFKNANKQKNRGNREGNEKAKIKEGGWRGKKRQGKNIAS